MSYKQMERRLADLEEAAAAKQRARLASLSDDELDALIADMDPQARAVLDAVADALSDEDLDRYLDGRMPDAEWRQHLERAQERINAAP